MPSPTDRNLTAPINPPRAHSMRTSQYVIVALALCITAACGDDNRGPTAPTAPTAPTSTSLTAVAPATAPVRVLYAAPRDREFRSDYRQGIQNALVDFQFWLRRELEGRTFSLFSITPEQCRLSENADFYSRGHAWDKVLSGVQDWRAGAWRYVGLRMGHLRRRR